MASREETIRKVLAQKDIPFNYKAISGAAADGEISMDFADEAMQYFEDEIAADRLEYVKSYEVLSEDPDALRREQQRQAEEERLPGEMYRALGFDERGNPLPMSTFERLQTQLKSILREIEDYRNRPSSYEKMLERERMFEESKAAAELEESLKNEAESEAIKRADREYGKRFNQPLPKIPEGGDVPGGGR